MVDPSVRGGPWGRLSRHCSRWLRYKRKKSSDNLLTLLLNLTEHGYGRGSGVGRGLGEGPVLGVGVGLGVAVAVAVAVGVGVPPPAGAWIATTIGDPVLKKPTVALVVCGG